MELRSQILEDYQKNSNGELVENIKSTIAESLDTAKEKIKKESEFVMMRYDSVKNYSYDENIKLDYEIEDMVGYKNKLFELNKSFVTPIYYASFYENRTKFIEDLIIQFLISGKSEVDWLNNLRDKLTYLIFYNDCLNNKRFGNKFLKRNYYPDFNFIESEQLRILRKRKNFLEESLFNENWYLEKYPINVGLLGLYEIYNYFVNVGVLKSNKEYFGTYVKKLKPEKNYDPIDLDIKNSLITERHLGYLLYSLFVNFGNNQYDYLNWLYRKFNHINNRNKPRAFDKRFVKTYYRKYSENEKTIVNDSNEKIPDIRYKEIDLLIKKIKKFNSKI